MLLVEVATASADIGALSSRRAKIDRIAAALTAGEADAGVVVAWLSGDLQQRQIGVGWASLRDVAPPAAAPTLTVSGVDAVFSEIKELSGAGSQISRTALLNTLFAAATEPEQHFLRRLLGGELRQGALAGVMADAVASAAGVPPAAVRRAAMLAGDLPTVAAAALSGGEAALAQFALKVGRPVSPMLAQSATDVTNALEKLGSTAIFETKLDGARVQIHRDGDAVSVFTRTLDDVTARLPEVVAAALALPVTTLIADAEAIALQPDGRPHRFQVTASHFGRTTGRTEPLSVFFFDVMHCDGIDLLDLPTSDRIAVLDRIVPAAQRVDRRVTSETQAAQQFLEATLAAGHEGVMAKSPTAPYEAGRRGAGWLKVKPVHTLDLVVLAVAAGGYLRVALGWPGAAAGAPPAADAPGPQAGDGADEDATDDALAARTAATLVASLIASAVVRDLVIGMSDGLTVPFALAAGLYRPLAGDDGSVKGGKYTPVRSVRSEGFFRFRAFDNGFVAIFPAGLW